MTSTEALRARQRAVVESHRLTMQAIAELSHLRAQYLKNTRAALAEAEKGLWDEMLYLDDRLRDPDPARSAR